MLPVIISPLSSPEKSFTAVVPRVESVDRFFVALVLLSSWYIVIIIITTIITIIKITNYNLAGHKGKSADFSSRLGFVGASSHALGLTVIMIMIIMITVLIIMVMIIINDQHLENKFWVPLHPP